MLIFGQKASDSLGNQMSEFPALVKSTLQQVEDHNATRGGEEHIETALEGEEAHISKNRGVLKAYHTNLGSKPINRIYEAN